MDAIRVIPEGQIGFHFVESVFLFPDHVRYRTEQFVGDGAHDVPVYDLT
jgi:hypothetical protein